MLHQGEAVPSPISFFLILKLFWREGDYFVTTIKKEAGNP